LNVRNKKKGDDSPSQTEIWLLYREKQYNDNKIIELLDEAWEVLLDTGYAGIFGAYRGVHYNKSTDEICITFQKQLSTDNQIMMVAFDKKMDWRIDFAYKELIEKEANNIKNNSQDRRREEG